MGGRSRRGGSSHGRPSRGPESVVQPWEQSGRGHPCGCPKPSHWWSCLLGTGDRGLARRTLQLPPRRVNSKRAIPFSSSSFLAPKCSRP